MRIYNFHFEGIWKGGNATVVANSFEEAIARVRHTMYYSRPQPDKGDVRCSFSEGIPTVPGTAHFSIPLNPQV